MSGVLLFDFMSQGFGHSSFNRCLAEVALNLPGCDHVEVHAEAEHLRWLRPLLSGLGSDAFSLHEVALIPTSAYAPLQASRQGCEAAVAAIRAAIRRSGARHVFVLGYTGLLLRQIRLSSLEKEAWIGLLGHGNVAEVMQPMRRNPFGLFQSMRYQLRRSFPAGIDLIALEASIAEELSSVWGVNRKPFRILELPVVPEEVRHVDSVAVPSQAKTVLNLGFLGDPRPQKGFGQFLSAAAALSGSCFRFHAIGRRVQQMPTQGLEGLATQPLSQPYERMEYLSAIRSLDLVCVPFLPEYRLIPSASLTDAVAQLIPLVYPLEPAFKSLEKRYGRLGYGYEAGTPFQQVLATVTPERFLSDLPGLKRSLADMQKDRLPVQQAHAFASGAWPGQP